MHSAMKKKDRRDRYTIGTAAQVLYPAAGEWAKEGKKGGIKILLSGAAVL